MIFTSENNWYTWQYGEGEIFGNQTSEIRPFRTNFSKCNDSIGNFHEELKKTAASTVDHYTGLRPSILFSGGVDSELVVRAYKDIGITPSIFIARYNNDINILDVSYAIAITTSLGLDYNLIDINLNHFYENEAAEISEISQIDYPRALPQLFLLKKIEEGFPILCTGDPSWIRTHSNYSIQGRWLHECNEYDIGWSKYVRYLDRPAIGEWFKWRPGIIISHSKLNWFRDLIADRYYGKLGVKSTKILGYREAYPDMLYRKKMTGFEGNVGSVIDEFRQFLEVKNKGFLYRNTFRRTLTDIENEIIG